MSEYQELHAHLVGAPDEDIAALASKTESQVLRDRKNQWGELTHKALENVLDAVQAGDLQASIWLLESKLAEEARVVR